MTKVGEVTVKSTDEDKKFKDKQHAFTRRHATWILVFTGVLAFSTILDLIFKLLGVYE